MKEKIIGKIYLKEDKTINFDIVEFEGMKFVIIPEAINLDLDLFNKKYFDIYEDI